MDAEVHADSRPPRECVAVGFQLPLRGRRGPGARDPGPLNILSSYRERSGREKIFTHAPECSKVESVPEHPVVPEVTHNRAARHLRKTLDRRLLH